MDFIVTTLLFVIIGVLTIVHCLTHHGRTGKLIDRIPGPKFLPIIGNIIDLIIPPESLWKLDRRYADEHYSIYKFWVGHWPIVSLRHPDDVEVLLGSRNNITKSMTYELLEPWLKEGLLTSTGDKWRRRRKTLTPAFHFNMLQEFVEVFIKNSERMVESLRAEGTVVKDVVPFLAKYTLNAICETAMGTTLEDEDLTRDKYRASVQKMGFLLNYRAVRPWLKNDWIFSLTKKGKERAEALDILHTFTTKIINKRKKYHNETAGEYLKVFSQRNNGTTSDLNVPAYDEPLKKKGLALLDLLIAVQKERKDIDDLGIREEVDTFIFEGHDTTDVGLSFAILLLAEHKEIQARARSEIDSVMKEADGKLGMKELQNLSYLDRCIKESLRMFPAVPTISRAITHDMQLKKYLIPRGTTVILHIFDVHRDQNFWPHPHVYDPDRFLPDRIKNRHPFSYIPFSGGPRNCIGQKYAMLELKVFLAYLLHNFYLEILEPTSNVRMVPDLVLKSITPLNVRFTPIHK